MIYHISANFGTEFNYHTELESTSLNQDQLLHKAKQQISKKIKQWGFEPSQIVSFDLYYFNRWEEVLVFTYKKENDNV